MKELNLKLFKKVASDKHSSTLKHKDGHVIKIAHKALSDKMRSELDKLPMHKPMMMKDGGDVDNMGKLGTDNTLPKMTDEESRQEYKERTGEDYGTEIKRQGKPVSHDDQEDKLPPLALMKNEDFNEHNASPEEDAVPFQDLGKNVASYDFGANPEQSKDQTEPTMDAGFTSNSTPAFGSQQEQMALIRKYELEGKLPPGTFEKSFPGQQLSPKLPDQGLAETGTPNALMTADQQQNPQVAQAQDIPAQEEPAPQQEQPQAPAAAPVEQAVQTEQNVKQDLTSEAMAWQHDLQNGHITPETYHDLFAKKDTLGKIGSIFGMMLSGFGSGLSHQPNAFMKMMDTEIQNDLDAQKQSKSNALNFIKLNNEHQLQQSQIRSNDIETAIKAHNLAHVQMNITGLHELVEMVNKMPIGSPQRAQAEQTLAYVSQQVDAQNGNLIDRAAASSAFYKTMFGSPEGASTEQQFQKRTAQMRMMGPIGEKRAQELEEKHVPGVPGQASVPLTASDREAIQSGNEFHQSLKRFMDWTSKHSGDLSPSDMNTGKAMAAELQGKYRNATHGGVFKEGEQNFIGSIIDSKPTKFFNSIRVMPQLQALYNENQQKMDSLLKSKGFPGLPQEQQNSVQEGQTGNWKGQPAVFKNGKWFIK